MAALTSQKIRASFEQVLHVDRDGGGNGATLVNVKDGDNGTTFAIELATTHISQPDGTHFRTDKIRARDGDGLYVVDDGDNGLFIADGGNVFLGDTANAKMTLGLTVNQGANDDEIVTLKSSDVAHGMTVITETDSFFTVRKSNADNGGTTIRSLADTGSTAFAASGMAVTGNTTKTAAGQAPVMFNAYIKNGTGVQSVGADGNIFTAGDNGLVRFIIDEDGDFHYDGADGGAFDDYDDAILVRALDVDNSGIIQSKFDEFVRNHRSALIASNILGQNTVKEEPFTGNKTFHRGFVNGSQLQRLHNGAIWQGRLIDHAIIQTVRELMPDRFDETLQKNMEGLGIGHINILPI